MKKYLALFIAVILAFSLILTACTEAPQSSSSEESSVPESSASEPESSASEPESSASEPEESTPALEPVELTENSNATILEIGDDYLLSRYVVRNEAEDDWDTFYFVTYFDTLGKDIILGDLIYISGTLIPLDEPIAPQDPQLFENCMINYSLDAEHIERFVFNYDNYIASSIMVSNKFEDHFIIWSSSRYIKVPLTNSDDFCEGDYVKISGALSKLDSPLKYGCENIATISRSSSDSPNSYEVLEVGNSSVWILIENIPTEVIAEKRSDFEALNIQVGEFIEFSSKYSSINEVEYEFINPEITPSKAMTGAKPVIYLYPEKEMEVEVSLDLIGEFTCVYPEYNDSWKVTAQPDGTLTDALGREYYCLYWEAEFYRPLVDDTNIGFMVKGEDTAEFLREKLLQIGLSEREANEFIIYWLPQMQHNNYNYIYFSFDEYEEVAKLNVSGNPDTVIRFMMVWEGLEEARPVIEQELPETPERVGFTVVEWGGSEIK